ncbi:unnamed protein product [Nezara viridula]|uniref:Uncharacterized protein n=1 Tax=Nezara viridula TaxID=85310 RepID=A0A9P0MUC3_NEZVI|nr:unnamed protein product [Nezara viridula]
MANIRNLASEQWATSDSSTSSILIPYLAGVNHILPASYLPLTRPTSHGDGSRRDRSTKRDTDRSEIEERDMRKILKCKSYWMDVKTTARAPDARNGFTPFERESSQIRHSFIRNPNTLPMGHSYSSNPVLPSPSLLLLLLLRPSFLSFLDRANRAGFWSYQLLPYFKNRIARLETVLRKAEPEGGILKKTRYINKDIERRSNRKACMAIWLR